MSERFLRWINVLGPSDKLVKVVSWMPSLYRHNGRWELTWPAMLVDGYGYRRATISPVWDRTRFKLLFTKARSHD